jgi:hypothetical protein
MTNNKIPLKDIPIPHSLSSIYRLFQMTHKTNPVKSYPSPKNYLS